jgi:hypothetical protein
MKWRYPLRFILLPAIVLLAGCFFEDNDEDSAAAATISVGGAGVKGPLVGAEVNLYLVDLAAADLKGAQQGASGTTGADAAIEGLDVPDDLSGLVLLEFAVVAGTTDLTTGAAPIFDNLITVVDASRLASGDIYASVLTTMVVKLAIRKADSGTPYSGDANGTISADEFTAALTVAQSQVKSTLGFGLDSTTDIFTTSPLITSATTTPAQQAQVAAYRQAIEAVAAISNAVSESGGGATAQEAFDALTEDLSDGTIDGQSDTGAVAAFADVTGTLQATVTQDVSTLMIPGTTTTVGAIASVLTDERAATGNTGTATDDLVVVPPTPAVVEVDSDSDGVVDSLDAFPADENETVDTDQDGVGDNGDAFPEDATETVDTDQDGVGDNTDAFPEDETETVDTDGDGTGDNSDAFPEDATETADTDADGVGDNGDAFPEDETETTDTDGDGTGDNSDAFPEDATETADTDGDGLGDNSDPFPAVPSGDDADNDGVIDSLDAFPQDPEESVDTDGDGTGDNGDAFPEDETETTDTDGDGTGDNADAFPTDETETADTDGDGTGDNADAFPNDETETTDTDGDGTGDNGDAFPEDATETLDSDGDGVGDNSDNCVDVANADQASADGIVGDACASSAAAVWDQFNWDDGSTWQ